MTQKTIRVDGPVHAHLEDKKAEYSAETFNEVLKRELGIIPDPSELDKLAAYFAPELHDAVQQIVEVIRNIDDLHEHVEETEYGDDYKLVFTDPETGMDIAYIEFGDNRFDYYYRNTKREWEQAAAGVYRKRNDELQFGDSGAGTYDHIELSDVKDTVRQTLSGAIQRWRD
jgi:hypothetical protein